MMNKTEKVLNDIYEENKSMNRNIQRITNICLIAVLANTLKEAKEKGDDKLVGIGRLVLLALTAAQFLLLILDVSAFGKKEMKRK